MLLSLSITAILAATVAFFTMPAIYRSYRIHQIYSDNDATRLAGFNYIARHAGRDPQVLDATFDAMRGADTPLFVQLSNLLDSSNLWSTDRVPDDLWLRRIEAIVQLSGADTQVYATQLLADRRDLAEAPQTLRLLDALNQSDEAKVRYAVLLSAAELAGGAKDPATFRPLIVRASQDADEGLAYHGWIIRGLLGFAPTPEEQAAFDALPEMVQQAYALAADTLKDKSQYVPPALSAEAPAIDRILRSGLEVNEDDLSPLFSSPQASLRELGATIAAEHFSAEQNLTLARKLLTNMNDDMRLSGAILVGLTGQEPVGIEGDLAAALAAHPDWTEDDVRAMSDEQLASVGLQRRNVIDYWLANSDDDFVMKQHMRLARWMQGKLPEMDGQVSMLLNGSAMPQTTLALAMLVRQQPDKGLMGLDWLINPRGTPRVDLVNLLSSLRWYFVIEPHLEKIASVRPPAYLWNADRATQEMQTDVLRDWMLVTRGRLGIQ